LREQEVFTDHLERLGGEELAGFHIQAQKSTTALGLNKLVKLSLSIQTRTINAKYLAALHLSVQSTLGSL